MGLEGKKVKIFFKDGESVRCRVALVLEESIGFLIFKTDYGTESIPNANIVRVEVLNDN